MRPEDEPAPSEVPELRAPMVGPARGSPRFGSRPPRPCPLAAEPRRAPKPEARRDPSSTLPLLDECPKPPQNLPQHLLKPPSLPPPHLLKPPPKPHLSAPKRPTGLLNPLPPPPNPEEKPPLPNPPPTQKNQALEERVGGILMRIEAELDDAEKMIGEKLHVIDLDGDGLISRGELQQASPAGRSLFCRAARSFEPARSGPKVFGAPLTPLLRRPLPLRTPGPPLPEGQPG